MNDGGSRRRVEGKEGGGETSSLHHHHDAERHQVKPDVGGGRGREGWWAWEGDV